MIKEAETTTEHYKKFVHVLGKKNFSSKIYSSYDFIQIASKGMEASVITNFKTYFNLPRESAAHMLNISEPTLYRWVKSNKNLERNFSIKLLEITDLFLYGTEVFGNQENFFKWLNLPNTALGGMEPQELVEIPEGVYKVRQIIGRIEHGVYS